MYADDQTRLLHMRDAAHECAEFARAHARAELSGMLWRGLVNCIEVIGEAATKVTEDLRQRHPQVAWAQIIGMRHRLVHDYDQINRDIVWDVATRDLPPLVVELERILAEWPEPPPPPG